MQKAKLILLNDEAATALRSIMTAAMRTGTLGLAADISLFNSLLEKSADVNVSPEFIQKTRLAEKLKQLSRDNPEMEVTNG